MTTDAARRRLLEEIWRQARLGGGYPKVQRFRLDHEALRDTIDELLAQDLVRASKGRYVITLEGLRACRSAAAGAGLQAAAALLPLLQAAYRHEPEAPIRAEFLAGKLGKDPAEISLSLGLLSDLPMWHGRSDKSPGMVDELRVNDAVLNIARDEVAPPSGWHITGICVARYKGYEDPCSIELRPLTVLIGANNAGKSALARSLPLVAGALAGGVEDDEVLPLTSFGLSHGRSFEDLITDRAPHGHIELSLSFLDAGRPCTLDATIQHVVGPRELSLQVVTSWRLRDPSGVEVTLTLPAVDAERHQAQIRRQDGTEDTLPAVAITWDGLLAMGEGFFEPRPALAKLMDWSQRLRYLRSPRAIDQAPIRTRGRRGSVVLDVDGALAPQLLASDAALFDQVRHWYDKTFGVKLQLRDEGHAQYLEIRGPTGPIDLAQAGQGLSQVLPVAVMILTAGQLESGIDIIEHPEAELHPAAHAAVAQLLLDNLAGCARPLVVETHSEVLLLRLRRKIAERQLDPDDVALYWVENGGARRIGVTARGEVESWPEGVFSEEYEEIMAMRRAARQHGKPEA